MNDLSSGENTLYLTGSGSLNLDLDNRFLLQNYTPPKRFGYDGSSCSNICMRGDLMNSQFTLYS